MNHYPMHPGDYLRDTAHLSIIEDAVYRRILDWLYTNERPLPTDSAKVARLMRAIEHQDAVDAVLNEFLELTADGWVQRRAEREIAEYKARADSARENGRRGGRPKTEVKPKITDPVNSDLPEKTELKTNHNQNQNQNTPPTPQGGDEDEMPAVWTAADSRKYSAMTLEWEPDPKTLEAYLSGKAANGRPVTAADVRAWLPDWRENAHAEGKTMTDAQWALRLVRYVTTRMVGGQLPSANQPAGRLADPLAFTEENRPKHGPYALLKPEPPKKILDEEGRRRVDEFRRKLLGEEAA